MNNIYIVKTQGADGMVHTTAMREGSFISLAPGQKLISVENESAITGIDSSSAATADAVSKKAAGSPARSPAAEGPSDSISGRADSVREGPVISSEADSTKSQIISQDNIGTQTLTIHSGNTVGAVKIFVPTPIEAGMISTVQDPLQLNSYEHSKNLIKFPTQFTVDDTTDSLDLFDYSGPTPADMLEHSMGNLTFYAYEGGFSTEHANQEIERRQFFDTSEEVATRVEPTSIDFSFGEFREFSDISGIDIAGFGAFGVDEFADISEIESLEETFDTTSPSETYRNEYIEQFVVGETAEEEAGVVAANKAPINSVPGAQSVNEDATLTFNDANGNKVSISDEDASSNPVKVTLTATNGIMSLNGTSGLTFTTGDGTEDSSMVFTGAVTDINAALDGLTFTGDSNFHGDASIDIVTDDQGNSGSGGSLTDSDTVSITVNSVNDFAPINNVPALNQSVNEDETLTFNEANGNAISVVDADDPTAALKVSLTATNGTMSLSGTSGLTFTTGDGTNDASMVFTGTSTNINSGLDGLTFTGDSNFFGDASIRIVTDDQDSGGALTDDETVNIIVNSVNDAAPVNNVPALAQSVDEDATLTFNDANGNAISVFDADDANAELKVTLTATNGTMSVSGTSGLTFTTGDGTNDASMVFTGTAADINSALDGLTFTGDANYSGAASIRIITDDQDSGGALTDDETVNITVNEVNDAPVNSVPSTQDVDEGATLTFNDANSNKISISDIDAGSDAVKVTLTATNGTMTLSGTAGLTFTTGDGTADSSMVFTGTIANINSALDGMSFAPTANFFGNAAIQLVTDDQDSGGALTDTDTINISVTPVSIDASSDLDGTSGFTITNNAISIDNPAAASIGDVNNDGYEDWIIGGGNTDAYVIFGKASGYAASIDVSTLDGTNGFNITHNAAIVDSKFSQSVAGAGDINGDGFDDILVGEYQNDNTATKAGATYVIFGKGDWSSTDTIDVTDLDGSNGFVLNGVADSDFSGRSISSAGDVNKDGYDDIIIGAFEADSPATNSGESYLVFGKADGWGATFNLSSLASGDGSAGMVLKGISDTDESGISVSGGGDINGDGYDDYIIGARKGDLTYTDGGETYVIFGKASGYSATFDLSTLDGTNGFTLYGPATNWQSGASVSSLGDINGDGYDDIIVGAPKGEADAYVVFGKADWSSTATLDLSTLDGSNGFELEGDFSFGHNVASAGDFNADGYDDFIVLTERSGDANIANAYVIYGKADGWDASILIHDISDITSDDGFTVTGFDLGDGDYSINSAIDAGDTNGDGYDDIIIGAGSDAFVIFGYDTHGETTHAGTTGNDTLTGTAGADILVGDQGDDILDGAGGNDVLVGGSGNDILVFDSADTLKVAGDSGGDDTLRFDGSGLSLDLTAINNNLYTGIERIDLTGTGNNSLTLNVTDVLDISDSTNTLYVDGNAGDTVTSTGQGWTDNGTTTVEGTVYHYYSSGDAELYVDDTVTQTIS